MIASIIYELCWVAYVVLSQTAILWVPVLAIGVLIGSMISRRRRG